jgi:predicted nucleic acid-binding protein
VIVTYLDSSALVRLCVRDGDVEAVEAAMDELPISSVLAEVEVPAAIHARLDRGQISASRHREQIELAGAMLDSVGMVGLSAKVRQEAVSIASRTLVRSLDAIHVATAAVAGRQQRRRGNKLVFCTADRRQAAAAAMALGQESVLVLPELPAAGAPAPRR